MIQIAGLQKLTLIDYPGPVRNLLKNKKWRTVAEQASPAKRDKLFVQSATKDYQDYLKTKISQIHNGKFLTGLAAFTKLN